MQKTIAELRQELQDAGRDVRMAGEMVERATGGSQDRPLIIEALTVLVENYTRVLGLTLHLDRIGRDSSPEAAK